MRIEVALQEYTDDFFNVSNAHFNFVLLLPLDDLNYNGMKYISAEKLAQDLQRDEDLVLLDIRENYEYEVCKIQSLHIPMHYIPVRAKELKPESRTVIICRTGNRASAVANYLEANYNFKNVEVLEGGIVAYAEKVDHQLDTEY